MPAHALVPHTPSPHTPLAAVLMLLFQLLKVLLCVCNVSQGLLQLLLEPSLQQSRTQCLVGEADLVPLLNQIWGHSQLKLDSAQLKDVQMSVCLKMSTGNVIG
mgnify:CR=1 FL=1